MMGWMQGMTIKELEERAARIKSGEEKFYLCPYCKDTGYTSPCSEAAARGAPMGFKCDSCSLGKKMS